MFKNKNFVWTGNLIELDHGSGGLASRDLIENVVRDALGAACLSDMEDSALLEVPPNLLAFTTDSFVVDPLFFDGGDIGKLAVCGTVNDLAVSGAIPLYISLGLIIEEGYPVDDLIRILRSVSAASLASGVKVACGDTKVLPRGKLDRIAINTSGIGYVPSGREPLKLRNVSEGDHLIVSGYIGDHGLHIMSLREGLGYESRVISDCAPLNQPIQALIERYGSAVKCARDITRGGIATILHEIETELDKPLKVDVSEIPLRAETSMGADMLGVSPYHLANEGCFLIIVDKDVATQVVNQLKSECGFPQAADIGSVLAKHPPADVSLSSVPGFGPLYGKILPRLC